MNFYDILLAKKLSGGGGITPTGTINITQNGDSDVTNYATARVAVPQPSGKITIQQNGTDIDVAQYASADVAVPQPSGTVSITQNGTVDVTQYASAEVNVSGGGGDETLAAVIDRSITSITIPSTAYRIGPHAFREAALKSVVVPSGPTEISDYAFYRCFSLETVDLADSISYIGSNAFGGDSALMSITVRRTTPPTLSNSALSSVPADCAIYVPSESVAAYKAASNWSSRAAYIQAIPSA